MKIKKFEEIEAWKSSRELVNIVYKMVKRLPFSRDFALRDQIIRAAISTMANIAEGFDSGTNQQFIQFLLYSRRSASEVQSELYVALDNNYINKNEFEDAYFTAENVRKLCSGLITYLRNYKNDYRKSGK